MAIYRQATTMTLAAIVACQVGNLFASRSEWTSIQHLPWRRNRLLWIGIGVECLALLAFIYVTPLRHVFGTAPLTPRQWFLLLLHSRYIRIFSGQCSDSNAIIADGKGSIPQSLKHKP